MYCTCYVYGYAVWVRFHYLWILHPNNRQAGVHQTFSMLKTGRGRDIKLPRQDVVEHQAEHTQDPDLLRKRKSK